MAERIQKPVSIHKYGQRYGLIAAIGMVIYFLIMRALGLADNSTFRYVGYIFPALGVYLALRSASHHLHHKRISYLPGLALVFWTAATTAILFAIFLYIYVKFIDRAFLVAVENNVPMVGDITDPFMFTFLNFGETLAIGIILGFAFMMLFKRNMPDQVSEEQEVEAEKHIYDKPEGRA